MQNPLVGSGEFLHLPPNFLLAAHGMQQLLLMSVICTGTTVRTVPLARPLGTVVSPTKHLARAFWVGLGVPPLSRARRMRNYIITIIVLFNFY